jgi:hypothetical protein
MPDVYQFLLLSVNTYLFKPDPISNKLKTQSGNGLPKNPQDFPLMRQDKNVWVSWFKIVKGDLQVTESLSQTSGLQFLCGLKRSAKRNNVF